MFTLTNIVIFAIGAVFLAMWLICFLKGLRNASLFDVLDEKEYPLRKSTLWATKP